MRPVIGASFAAAMAALVLAACGNPAARAQDSLDPLPDTTRPVAYHLSFTPDVGAMRFAAHQTARFEVLAPTREIELHSAGLALDAVRADGEPVASVVLDQARQRAVITTARTLQPGLHELQIDYTGRIQSLDSEGLFKRNFVQGDGQPGEALYTMTCCLSVARELAPLWDETRAKAIFEIDLTVPDGLAAVSNMPVAKREALGGGRSRVSFRPTPRMSSYLLFFAIGDFERLATRAGEAEVGIVVRRGLGHRAQAALDASRAAVEFFGDYLAYPFPLPKLDGIGVPGASDFVGMENFGAITYSEQHVIAGPAWSSQSEQRHAFALITHEIAHQWFGDLVTAASWDELWLNEGFAQWLEGKATAQLRPEWTYWMHDGAAEREEAMGFDALGASFPIVPNHSFSGAITYAKSAQVLRMIEAWVGEEAFRTAMRAYVRAHAFGNATSRDVWQALAQAAGSEVADIGRDFTTQAGVPLIEVSGTGCVDGGARTAVTLRQSRFGLDEASRARQTWSVPVTAVIAGRREVARTIVRGPDAKTLELPGCGPVKLNSGETGYFRTHYDPASLAWLAQAFDALPAADQIGLLNDAFALGEGGYAPFSAYLDLAQRVPAQAHPMVLFQLADRLQALDALLDGSPARPRFRAYARGRLSALLSGLGWTPEPDEPANTSVLRARVVEALAGLGDPVVRAEARRRYLGASSDPALAPPQLADALLTVTGIAADATTFDALVSRARAARTLYEQRKLLTALASAEDAGLAARSLELTLQRALLPATTATVLNAVARRHPALALEFASVHFDDLQRDLDADAFGAVVPGIVAQGRDATLLPALAAFAGQRPDAADRQSVADARASVLVHGTLRRERLAPIETWLRAH